MRLVVCALFCFSTMVFLGGCNSGADNNEIIQMDYNPATDLKAGLEGVKKSGRLGSNVGALNAAARDLKKVDAAKGEMAEKELKELMSLSDEPAKLKAKAAELIGKL